MPQNMQSLITKYVSEIQKLYGIYLRQIILYGSYARGDFHLDSDVDIMILLDMSDLKLKEYSQQLSYMTYDFNLDYDIDIKPIVKSEAHFKKWVVTYPFYANIQKEGVVLYVCYFHHRWHSSNQSQSQFHRHPERSSHHIRRSGCLPPAPSSKYSYPPLTENYHLPPRFSF